MVQPPTRKRILQGRRWLPINITRAAMNVKKKIVDDKASLEKFVGGARTEIILSCAREKSSIQFCRSRILRKKSFESSFAGLTVGAGARAGPVVGYCVEDSTLIVDGGAGCLAMKEGMSSPNIKKTSGRAVRRKGSRHTKVYIARKDNVCEGYFHESSRIAFAWNTKTTPIRALNLRKLFDIVVILKEGRATYSDWEWFADSLLEDWSSMGITCCRSLYHMLMKTCSSK
jgi:hypothetical protein